MAEIIGTVTGLSQYYVDGTERMEIWVNKASSQGLPNQDGKRVPIKLFISSRCYSAGIRSTVRNREAWICPDLIDESKNKVSLAGALLKAGFRKNQKVVLKVEGRKIIITPYETL